MFFTEERRKAILTLLKVNKKIYVNELSERFQVSSTTIRNDLTFLEKKGYLKRTFGGAIQIQGVSFEMINSEKYNVNLQEKIKIGKYAASLVEDGDTIALDCGTTTYCMAEFLDDKKHLTVITNDLKIALLFEEYSHISTIFIGGTIRKGFSCTVGAIANNFINTLKVDKSFIVANTISDEFAVSTPDSEQAEIKKQLMNIATQKYLLCDSSKFNQVSLITFASLHDFDEIITDEHLDNDILRSAKKQAIKLTAFKGENEDD
ncbi:MAG: DeoR/GlpR family DNA-binding transcription regulator [Bacilli bacterium]